MQATGLVKNAEDNVFFTFNNTSRPRLHHRDSQLLQALNDPRIAAGSTAEDVVEIYRQRLPHSRDLIFILSEILRRSGGRASSWSAPKGSITFTRRLISGPSIYRTRSEHAEGFGQTA